MSQQLVIVIKKNYVEEASDVIFPLKLGKLTYRSMDNSICISSDLVNFNFGFYHSRHDFDSEGIFYSLFGTHINFLLVHDVEYFWEDCADELEVWKRESSRFTIS